MATARIEQDRVGMTLILRVDIGCIDLIDHEMAGSLTLVIGVAAIDGLAIDNAAASFHAAHLCDRQCFSLGRQGAYKRTCVKEDHRCSSCGKSRSKMSEAHGVLRN